MSNPARGQCPECGKRVRLTVEGKLYAHWWGGGDAYCWGTGREPVEGTVKAPLVETEVPSYSRLDKVAIAAWWALILAGGFLAGYAYARGFFPWQ